MRLVWATGVNALFTLAVQLVALIALSPAQFGAFSIQYLFFALSLSVALSFVSEPWLRVELRSGGGSDWRLYSSVSFYFALVAGLGALVLSLIVPPLRDVAVLGAIAVAASAYRASARYYSLRRGDYRGVLPGDIGGLAGYAVGVVVLLILGASGLVPVIAAWALGALASALLSRLPKLGPPSLLRVWVHEHRSDITLLLRDSLFMDLGAIGAPYLLAPAMGLADFGIYRAVSNIAAPVRLVLGPIRPRIAARPLAAHRRPRAVVLVVGVSVLFGVAAFAALLVLDAVGFELGALAGLLPYALPAAIFVGSGFAGNYFYVVARATASGRRLLIGRAVQTVLAVGLPLGGMLAFGLEGAIWGVSLSSAISAVVWTVLALRGVPGRSGEADLSEAEG